MVGWRTAEALLKGIALYRGPATPAPFAANASSVLPRAATLATTTEDYDLIAEDKGLARIDGYAEHGFIVNNDTVQGPILCMRTLCTSWKVERLECVTLDSLAALDILKPAPELLVLGCGRELRPLPSDLVHGLAAKGISVEASDTCNAVATFNILNQEGRAVAAALLPLAA